HADTTTTDADTRPPIAHVYCGRCNRGHVMATSVCGHGRKPTAELRVPPDLAAVTVGDQVRVGIGAAAWTVTALEPWGDTILARVQRGGITELVRADRLTVVRTP
ncbi:MAG TPA: hypothetical protein VGF17_08835, partial [Phytomonospora sp.]